MSGLLSPWTALVFLPLAVLFFLLSALIERSGPIRMRHWVEEAGGSLRALYEHPIRFEVFRYLLNLLAKIAPVGLFLAFAAGAERFAPEAAAWIGLVGVTVVLAAIELANRALLRRGPEAALRQLTWLYSALLVLLTPLIFILVLLVPQKALAQPEGENGEADEASEEEIEAFIDVGTREGILEPEQRDLVWGVVDFGDTQVKSVMTPRIDMVCAPHGESLDALVELFVTSGFSRIPLYRESIDQIAGILHIRDLLAASRSPEPKPASELAQPPFFVPEAKQLGELLRELQARRQQMAIVLDEYGGTAGLVTIEDLLEEIVGEIADEHDEAEPEQQPLPDGSLRLDGRAHVEILDEYFGLELEEEPYETVGGLVSSVLGYVPKGGETLSFKGLRFAVERADERRILTLRVARLPEAEQDAS